MIYYINMYQSKDVYFLYIIHKNIYFSIVSYDKKWTSLWYTLNSYKLIPT